jgi:hypothetical protein
VRKKWEQRKGPWPECMDLGDKMGTFTKGSKIRRSCDEFSALVLLSTNTEGGLAGIQKRDRHGHL